MTPVNSDGGGAEIEVTTELMLWARSDGRGKVFGSNAALRWLIPRYAPMPRGSVEDVGMRLAGSSKKATLPYVLSLS